MEEGFRGRGGIDVRKEASDGGRVREVNIRAKHGRTIREEFEEI